MPATLVLLAYALAFLAATALANRLPSTMRFLPHAVLAALSLGLFFELARYDQGYPGVLYTVGFLAAPIIAIFGGAAWGSRRLYGWPDLGPGPPRAALIAAAVLAGVLWGVRHKERDVRETEARVNAWINAGAKGPPPRTTLGFVAPPPVAQRTNPDGTVRWSFPLGNDRWRERDPASGTWRTAHQHLSKEK